MKNFHKLTLTNILVLISICFAVGYLFFTNLSWFTFDYINKHEFEFQIYSNQLLESIRGMDIQEFFSLIFNPGRYPFLTGLLLSFFKLIFFPISNEFLLIKSFYFFCFLITMLFLYYYSLAYTVERNIFSGLIPLFCILSCPYYYHTLFEGQDPEDFIANTLLFILIFAYASYKKAIIDKNFSRIQFKSILVSVLLSGCFFAKYNVGFFLFVSILVDMFCLKKYGRCRIKDLNLTYLLLPFILSLGIWFLMIDVQNHILPYMRQHLDKDTDFDLLYYIKIGFTNSRPYIHSINGIWEPKDADGMSYFTHWGQGAIFLICIISLCIKSTLKDTYNRLSYIILPLIYVLVNFFFFTTSDYYHPTAMISTIPAVWLIVEFECNSLFKHSRPATFRKTVKSALVSLVLIYMAACAAYQYCTVVKQCGEFFNRTELEVLSTDINETINLKFPQVKREFSLQLSDVSYFSGVAILATKVVEQQGPGPSVVPWLESSPDGNQECGQNPGAGDRCFERWC